MKLRMAVWMAVGVLALVLVALHQAAQAAPQANTYIVAGANDPAPSACTPIIGGGYSCPSLRSAVIAANNNPGADIIQLSHGVTYTLALAPAGVDDATTGDLNITADTTFNFGNVICSGGNCAATIQGGTGWHDRILNIASGAHVDAFLLAIRNGNVTGADGGGILNQGTLSLSNSTIVSNTTNLWGGGGIQNYGTLMLTDTLILSNTANYGGGLATGSPSFYTTTATLNNCQIVGNQSINQGGGIYNFGTITIDGGTISHNYAKQSGSWGGGLAHDDGALIMTGTLVISNTAAGNGGGVSASGDVQMAGITVTQNMANGRGGGIDSFGNQVTIDRSAILTNTATSSGGGIDSGGNLTVTNSILMGNQTMAWGGGLDNNAVAQIINSQILTNTGDYGGGIENDGPLSLSGSSVQGNHSQHDGGGIDNASALTIQNSTVSNNSSLISVGGGINNGMVLIVTNSILSENRAASHGGGLYNFSLPAKKGIYGIATLDAVTVTGNIADYDANGTGDGGGIANDNYGVITLTNSTILNNSAVNGGGLANSITSTLLLANGTVMNNNAVDGGGIINSALITVTNSTVNGNSSTTDGGGIYNVDAMSLLNDTISGNHTNRNGGGLANNITTTLTTADLNNVTIANNQADSNNDGVGKGGGVAVVSGTLLIRNTLIGQNNDVSSQAPDCSGIVTSDRYNLVQNTTGCTLSSNLVGNVTGQNPLIGPLQNNGGSTWTHALLQNSPAINTGNPTAPGSGLAACLPTDQRGWARPNRCDIGAYEYGGLGFGVYLPLVLK